MNKAKIKRIAGIVVAIILGVFLFIAGQAKFSMSAVWGKHFIQWGYPAGSHYVVGVLEMLIAIGILIPKTRVKAAWAAGIVMVAAALTHLLNGQTKEVLSPGIYMVFIAAVILLNRKPKALD